MIHYSRIHNTHTQESSIFNIMTTRTSHGPPFRAEQLGSLLRPQDLLAKRDDIDKGSATEKDLTPIEDRAIKTAVKQQLDMGYRGVTDGEYR